MTEIGLSKELDEANITWQCEFIKQFLFALMFRGNIDNIIHVVHLFFCTAFNLITNINLMNKFEW